MENLQKSLHLSKLFLIYSTLEYFQKFNYKQLKKDSNGLTSLIKLVLKKG
jgi:hypothetical protein